MSTPTKHSISSESSLLLKRVAFGFWALLLIVVIVKCFVAPRAHAMYPSYAATGRAWWFGSNELDSGIGIYGPFFAQLIGPFCALPDNLGGSLWYVVSFLFSFSAFINF